MIFIKKMEKVLISSFIIFCLAAFLGIYVNNNVFRWIIFAIYFVIKGGTEQYFRYLAGNYIKMYYKELMHDYDKILFPFKNIETTGIYLTKKMLIKYGEREYVDRYILVQRLNIILFFISVLPIMVLYTFF